MGIFLLIKGDWKVRPVGKTIASCFNAFFPQNYPQVLWIEKCFLNAYLEKFLKYYFKNVTK
jgi:hypothetical protein